jgi:hypothetical protein
MPEVEFGSLEDLPLREAWKDEARVFTPWLATNIHHLAEAIGMSLEIDGTEVLVGSYYADILARNPQDGSLVLIENQLEEGDHSHLGQIMTYLAGLKVQTVIWIEPAFREPHLSAIRWLNEHTAEDFSFFAVRLRVVRIGNSPFAPIFEIVEKPNDWDREVRKFAESEGSAYYDVKESFWKALLVRHPALAELGIKVWRLSNNYVGIGSPLKAEISIYLARWDSGIYVRSPRGTSAEPTLSVLEQHQAPLEQAMDAELGPYGRGTYFFLKKYPKGHEDEESWPEIIDWMNEQIAVYRNALTSVFD